MHDTSPSRRALLKAGGALGTVAALAVPVAVLPKAQAAPADPVFAAIANVRRDYLAFDDVMNREEDCFPSGKPVCASLLAESRAVVGHLQASTAAALRTVPTTREGMLAYLDFVQSRLGWAGLDMPEAEVGDLCATIRTFVTKEAHRG
ncbi:hypothetical protein [Xanthobacter aminoxidans]|uniref:hypothetical protein n=1 Tax=Xanthobacter aminoxidans TaxID=186280 RepID=UPI002022D4F3|nr:hypothetical protein [Xanthobacter aminoxidans]MCL8382470.1 hypothetical protein [Xanthobacter aminoxidans]